MKVLGLTGGIGSGKSTVAAIFAAQGVPVVDTDEIAHRITAPQGAAIEPIRAAFGVAVLDAAGALDRAAMRQIVFADPAQRERLESILHPLIRQEARDELARYAAAGRTLGLLVVPLLYETGSFRQDIDATIVVDCPETLQRERILARPGMDGALADRIIAAQAPREARLRIADYVLSNTGSREELEQQTRALLRIWNAQ